VTAAIEVVGLRKAYGGRAVLREVSIDVAPGEVFALLGPNGAGKTTAVEIIEGYRSADAGSVRVLGTDPRRGGRAHRARVGLMLQGGGGIDPRMTGREVVRLHARLHADPRDPDELLDLVGLTGAAAATRDRRLAGGERQRVGLALALVGRPEVAILDEPTAGMDVEARLATRALLADLRNQGVTVLLTSHDLSDVERVADRIAILDRGQIVGQGSATELTAGGDPVLRFRLPNALEDADLAELSAALGGSVEPDVDPGRYRLAGRAPDPALVARLAAWCERRGTQLLELRTVSASLEERYLELTRAAGDPADGGTGSNADVGADPAPRRHRSRRR
jgi:ABC-2 type transport system ATP-binding protein